ncbi:arylsulfatase [Halogranum rubrum]|uniref:Arylsulfatase n=1 Tax=Halogranum rubrum TaxID=553466 RepID=A0A1I4BAK1_9EURY|nr:sulfatase-like hydrolase/transferase [Halogranum rubrum]SFK65390.1 arylsulfatase [Halogranum rubrum]
MSGKPNIAVVVLDTLRYDFFTKYFNWLPGCKFKNAYTTSHWTVPAHASLFTGKYPSEVGVHSQSVQLDCKEPTLAEELSSNGYSTHKYSANLNVSQWGGWGRGFDIDISPDDLKFPNSNAVNWTKFLSEVNGSRGEIYIKAIKECFSPDVSTLESLKTGFQEFRQDYSKGGVRTVQQYLKNEDFTAPSFVFINLMDAHVPYRPPEEYRTIEEQVNTEPWRIPSKTTGSPPNKQQVQTAYRDSVRYLSDEFRNLYSLLEDEFDFILTLSDHGELLGEYDLYDHCYGLFPELTHIPLVVSGPNTDNKEISHPVSILDVHKTIGELSDTELDSRGRNLLELDSKQEFLTEFHGFTPWMRDQFVEQGIDELELDELSNWKYGLYTENNGYIYESSDGDIQTGPNSKIENPKQYLRKAAAQIEHRTVTENESVSEDVKTQLEKLGYA